MSIQCCAFCLRPDCLGECVELVENGKEPMVWLVLTETDAKRLVTALVDAHAYEAASIIKRQAWWPDLSRRFDA